MTLGLCVQLSTSVLAGVVAPPPFDTQLLNNDIYIHASKYIL